MTSPNDAWDQAEMPVTEHLRELRTRLIRAVAAVGIGALVLLWPAPRIIRLLIGLYFPGLQLHAFGPTDVIAAEIRFAVLGGVIIGLPVVVAQIWLFLVPAIAPRTRRLVYAYTLPSLALAACGIAFCHLLVLPRIAAALIAMTGDLATPTFGIGPTLNLVLTILFAFALIFQTPLVMLALTRLGILNTSLLRRYRRHTMMGMLIAGGVAAPDGSPLTMLLLAAPLYALFEISLLIITPLERRWKQAPAVKGGP